MERSGMMDGLQTDISADALLSRSLLLILEQIWHIVLQINRARYGQAVFSQELGSRQTNPFLDWKTMVAVIVWTPARALPPTTQKMKRFWKLNLNGEPSHFLLLCSSRVKEEAKTTIYPKTLTFCLFLNPQRLSTLMPSSHKPLLLKVYFPATGAHSSLQKSLLNWIAS